MSNARNTKSAFLVLLCVLVFVALLLVVWQFVRPETESPGSKSVSVNVTHISGRVRRHVFRTDREYLLDLMLDEKLVMGFQGDDGYVVVTVDPKFADSSVDQTWTLTNGGVPVTTPIEATPIDDGDIFEFVLSAAQP